MTPDISFAGIDDYEHGLANAVSATLPPASDYPVEGLRGEHVVFDRVAIEGSFPDSVLAVYVRDRARPKCRFAVAWRVWIPPQYRPPDGQITPRMPLPAEEGGAAIAENVERFVTVGLPVDCSEHEVTWVSTRSRVLDPSYYSARVLAALRQRYPDHDRGAHFDGPDWRCWVRQTYVEGEHPDQELVVLTADDDRPQCTFGFRFHLWDRDGRPVDEENWPTPEDHAWLLAINLEETLLTEGPRLPTDCTPGEITWVCR